MHLSWPFARSHLTDIRLRTAQNMRWRFGGISPGADDMWAGRWAAFSPLEKATWRACAQTETILAKLKHDTKVLPTGWPTQWSEDDRARFDCIAHDVQRRIGIDEPRMKPSTYGAYWASSNATREWYEWMYRSREYAHRDCLDWIATLSASAASPISVMDIGCGFGVGYPEALATHRFVGVDLGARSVAWCNENLARNGHSFVRADILDCADMARLSQLQCDLVISSGTIDNSWDMSAYLAAMASLAKRGLYLTAYRGWFPHLSRHRYMWSPETAAYYNDVSPQQLREELASLGFRTVEITPLPTGTTEPEFETRIVAVR